MAPLIKPRLYSLAFKLSTYFQKTGFSYIGNILSGNVKYVDFPAPSK